MVVGLAGWVGGGLLACGDDGVGGGASGELETAPDPVTFPRTDIGDTATRTFRLINTGEGELEIFEMTFERSEGVSSSTLSIGDRPEGSFSVASGEARSFEIEYAPQGRSSGNTLGQIEILSSDPSFSEGESKTVSIRTSGNRPNLVVDPNPIEIPQVAPGESISESVEITNLGNAPLTIYERPAISGSEVFEITSLDASFPMTLQPSGSSDGSGDVSTLAFEVQYQPTSSSSDRAELILETDEESGSTAENPTTTSVDIQATSDVPCVQIEPSKSIDVGSVPVGESATRTIRLLSCRSKPAVIDSIRVGAEESVGPNKDDDQEFTLDLDDRDSNDDGQLDEPIRLESADDSARVEVTYQPTSRGTDRAEISLQTNAPANPRLTIDLRGRGATGECPSAQVKAKVRGKSAIPRSRVTAAPLDYIRLDGSDSTDPDGQIVAYEWSVLEKPKDISVDLSPPSEGSGSSTETSRVFRVLTAGTYKIGLKVEDNDGFTSCNQAVATITAIPNESVHVELTWTNPKDPDETDDEGSDVDVHMVKMGPGKWFEAPYDIYFDNQGGTTGIWNPESPSLDIDDTNGAGPENIQMDDPAGCQWYAVGVHYFKQRFGTAYATVRIYINEELVYEQPNKPLSQVGQFWDVARIHWPTGRVLGVNDVQPAPPQGQSPVVTEAMKSSGLCTAEDLYGTSQ